jgi:hypothetical protein
MTAAQSKQSWLPQFVELSGLSLHSAMYYYDPKTLIHSTIAARTIEPGEEITIPCK